MIRFFIASLLCFLPVIIFSQANNLVPNPGFEERDTCMDSSSDVSQAPPWFSPTTASPDVFHECAVQSEEPCPYPETANLDMWLFGVPTNFVGCQTPHSDEGYAGIFFYAPGTGPSFEYREYLAVPLSHPLEGGTTYYVRYVVSLAERSAYAVWNFQALLTPDSITANDWTNLEVSDPLSGEEGNYNTDKESWQPVSWEYTAQGGEEYLYIGNFQSNNAIDTLPLESAEDIPFIYPVSYYYIDDVYVGTENPSNIGDHPISTHLKVWPNPASEYLYLESDKHIRSVSIFGVAGKLLRKLGAKRNRRLDISNWSPGIYFFRMVLDNGKTVLKKIMITDHG